MPQSRQTHVIIREQTARNKPTNSADIYRRYHKLRRLRIYRRHFAAHANMCQWRCYDKRASKQCLHRSAIAESLYREADFATTIASRHSTNFFWSNFDVSRLRNSTELKITISRFTIKRHHWRHAKINASRAALFSPSFRISCVPAPLPL